MKNIIFNLLFYFFLLSLLLTAIIGDPKFGVKIQRECFDNIVKHSHSAAALALNLLDNLIPKELQRISNIKGTNGKTPLNPSILAAIKGNIDFNLPVQKIVRSLFRLTCKYIASRLSMLN